MAASFALGGLGLGAGCRRPEEKILPYGKSVEGVIPGMPLFFATAMPLRRGAVRFWPRPTRETDETGRKPDLLAVRRGD
jgi:hypothetical protein